nr:MAG TPA: hypothetical protein [Bacteriophage sp.]
MLICFLSQSSFIRLAIYFSSNKQPTPHSRYMLLSFYPV